MDIIANVIGSLVPFLLLLGVIVTIHELGHYAAGRWFGAAVESFAVGFGNSIAEITDRRGTRWRVNWFPLGGFVKFVGDRELQDAEPESDSARPGPAPVGLGYTELAPWQRAIVSIAGPVANFVLAAIIFAALAMVQGLEVEQPVEVAGLVAGDPAERAGLRVGDRILSVDGRTVGVPWDVGILTRFRAGDPLVYRIERAGETIDIVITPERREVKNTLLGETETVGRIGLSMRAHTIERPGLFGAIRYGFLFTGELIRATHAAILRLLMFGEGLEGLRGPVGIWDVSDRVAGHHMESDLGFGDRVRGAALSLLALAGMLSVGIGYFNLLPLPILDGGRFFGCLVEMAARRSVPEQLRNWALTAGALALSSFFVLVTWQDLKRLGLFDFFSRFLS